MLVARLHINANTLARGRRAVASLMAFALLASLSIMACMITSAAVLRIAQERGAYIMAARLTHRANAAPRLAMRAADAFVLAFPAMLIARGEIITSAVAFGGRRRARLVVSAGSACARIRDDERLHEQIPTAQPQKHAAEP